MLVNYYNLFFNLLLIYLPLIVIFIIIIIPSNNILLLKKVSFWGTTLIFLLSLILLLGVNIIGINNANVNYSFFDFQIFSSLTYLFNIQYLIGIDGISILLIVLTTFLIPICVLINISSIRYRFKEYILMLLLLEVLLINTFSVLNIVFFYIFFEAVLIPMFIIIGIWGSRQRKIHAAYQFFLYTFFGSIFMLVSLLVIYMFVGSTNYELLLITKLPFEYEKLLWLAIFFAFAIKVPMIPVHIWLPEAHVEAPTSGSVLLAGILLKLGTYGILRFLIPIFPNATIYYLPFIYMFCLLGIIYGSLTTLRQIDLKKIIAYSSVVHMNFALIGLFSLTIEGIQGSIYLMLSHGIVSGALFLCVGCLYDRYHTRLLAYYNGLVVTMPLFALFFLIFTLANIAFPGTSSFVGEFLIFLGIFKVNIFIGLLSGLSVILSASYSVWLYNRVIFKQLNIKYFFKYRDLKLLERLMFYPLIILVFVMGIYPKLFLDISYFPVLRILSIISENNLTIIY